MSLEQDLKDAFARHADDTVPGPEAWTAIERRVRRAHRARALATTVGALALVAAAALVLPRVLTTEDRGFVAPGDDSPPGETVDPGDTSEWPTFATRFEDVRLRFPPGWQVSAIDDAIEITPPELTTRDLGQATFSVRIERLSEEQYDAKPQDRNLELFEMHFRKALRYEGTFVGAEREVIVRVDWTGVGSCPPPDPGDVPVPCPRPLTPETLQASVRASDESLWSTYGALGEAITQTLEPFEDPGELLAGPAGDTMRKFTVSRIRRRPAEAYLSEPARAQYLDGDPRLYEYAGEPFIDYRVRNRADLADGRAIFEVELDYRADSPAEPGFEGHAGAGIVERITVGPGTTHDGRALDAVILSSEVIETYEG